MIKIDNAPGLVIGGQVLSGTAGRILYEGAGPVLADSANLLYSETSGPRLQVGSGTTTSVGGLIGYSGTSGSGRLWLGSGVNAPTANNFKLEGVGNDTYLNAVASIVLSINGTTNKVVQGPTDGLGLAITAGTAVTDVAALSVTQTWNHASAATGVEIRITDTTSAAGALALGVYGGAAGTTALMTLGKAGALVIGTATITPGNGATTLYNTWDTIIGSANNIQLSPTSPYTTKVQALNAYSNTDDTAPVVPRYRAPNAYSQATVNTAGADIILGPGIGRRFATVVDYSALDAGVDTITITVNGTANVGTSDAATQDATHWVIGASNNATATNIATWADQLAGVTAAAVADKVYITADSTTHTLTIATNADAGEMTVTSGADGAIQVGKAVTAASVAANFSASHYIPIKDGLGTTYYLSVDVAAW